MEIFSLCGDWTLKNCTDNKTYEATIPGSNFGNLIKAGAIVNPLISGKEEEALEIAKNDFEFSKSFTISDEILKYENVNLKCESLDTLCECIINGKKAFSSKNSHLPVDINIKEFLVSGENTILFHFFSDYEYIKKRQKEKALPLNNNGVNGIPYLRKQACHFGWDWGPCVPYCGIIGNIEIVAFNKRIENIQIFQDTNKEKSVVTYSVDNASEVYIETPDGNKILPSDNKFVIENPMLWYTKELSQKDEQPLYKVVFKNEEETIVKEIGLRSLYLDRSKDEYGSTFCFVLNGERIFGKGANLIPFGAMPEDYNNDTIDYYLDLAEESNFNILRVWGGGTYASDYFMSQCDKRGILVWQDFCFACQLYPLYEDEFVENVLEEAKANVLRLNTHPSLALWCGNNEIEVMFSYMPKSSPLMKAYEKFFYHTLPEHIKDLTNVSYIPTSPVGCKFMKDYSSDKHGDTHMWNVWHGLKKLDYYQERYSRFLSEFGLESLPSMKAIKTFAKDDELAITSKSFNNHQKCPGGNEKMMFYLTEMFDYPKEFKYLPYLTGIVQAECIKNATVHFRQNKGRCNGSIFWQMNDVWNCPSWASVDFEGVPKALQYKSKEFFEPVTVSCKKEKGKAYIYAHNDTLYSQNFNIDLDVYDFDCNKISTKNFNFELKANSFKEIAVLDADNNTILRINYNGKKITEIFDAPCNIPLKKANIKAEIKGNTVEITTDEFAYNICIDSDVIPKENYFSLLKGETKTIEFNEEPKDIEVFCANNIEFESSKFKKKLFRLTYRLKPMNIGNYVYYSVN